MRLFDSLKKSLHRHKWRNQVAMELGWNPKAVALRFCSVCRVHDVHFDCYLSRPDLNVVQEKDVVDWLSYDPATEIDHESWLKGFYERHRLEWTPAHCSG